MATLDKKFYNISSSNKFYAFATYPSIKIYKKDTGKSWANHLLFGDYIRITDLEIINGRVKATCRGNRGWVNADELEKRRVLEVNFVDIGQGDGCHVVTPEDEHIIIDAGESDNMNRYLTWRFNLYGRRTQLPFKFTSVITHSDKDHYNGFQKIFDNDKIKFSKVYHNGLVERPGRNTLGKKEGDYLVDLITNTDKMKALIENPNNRAGSYSTYCKTLYKGLQNNPDLEFKSLSIKDKYVDGYDQDNNANWKEFSLEVLGPITKKVSGKDGLKTINNLGKDKNGHSVILKLKYGKATVLLGGDVNTEFGEILYNYYKRKNQLDKLTVDVAKACHHGSNHFHYDFLKSIHAAATVISSGDDENYAHPRPDAIGAFGKCGYGEKPLIFSTELARTNKEFTYTKLEGIAKLFTKLTTKKKELKELKDNNATTDKITQKKNEIINTNKDINSFVTKFGMINLRTDGNRMILAQKYERKAASGKWDIHTLKYSRSAKRFKLDEEH